VELKFIVHCIVTLLNVSCTPVGYVLRVTYYTDHVLLL